MLISVIVEVFSGVWFILNCGFEFLFVVYEYVDVVVVELLY